jgi:sugar (pentulose or hexulose) kinase
MKQTSALIDIGGSSVKVTICDSSAGKIYSHEVSITAKLEGKHIYLDPNDLFTRVIEAMNGSAQRLPAGLQINKIFVSTLRQGFCLVGTTSEITPIYLNSDTSGEYARKDIEQYGSSRIYEETGHWFAPQLTLPKIINLMRVKPQLFDKNTKLLFVHDWLIWKFTQIVQTEMTLVSAGQLANLSEKVVNAELLEHFAVPSSIMPTPRKFGSEIGTLKSAALALLSSAWNSAILYVGGGDSHFLHMGASGNKAGKVVVSAGSSTPISLLSPSLGSSTQLQPWKSTSFVDSDYLLEGNLGYPGSFYGWLTKNVSSAITSPKVNIENITKAPTVFGSCNMWNEEKWDSRPAFSMFGDFSNSNSNDLALGLTLDYAFALVNQISALMDDGFGVNQVVITGGGANSQIQAIANSLLDIPVDLMSSDVAIGNLFSILNGENLETLDFEAAAENLDLETTEFLREHSKNHAMLYQQVEGTRKVLENAK